MQYLVMILCTLAGGSAPAAEKFNENPDYLKVLFIQQCPPDLQGTFRRSLKSGPVAAPMRHDLLVIPFFLFAKVHASWYVTLPSLPSRRVVAG